jgi:hypothetical protein
MPALNFQARFAEDVESGVKTHTFRAFRKDGRDPKVRDTLYLFVGQRTKQCRKLAEGYCLSTQHLTFGPIGGLPTLAGDMLRSEEEERLARLDGFACFDDMVAFVRKAHGLPFTGLFIHWRLERNRLHPGAEPW